MAGTTEYRKLLSDVIAGDRALSNQTYNKWAQDYEADMKKVQYFGPTTLMEHFNKLGVPKKAKILDVCAGTGGIGRELAKLGYEDIHAIDGAEAMLAKAKEDGNYKSYTHLLFQPDSKLPFENGSFDCVLAAGVFAPGHLPIMALHEMCRVAKVGGVIAWICCDPKYYEDKDSQYFDGGFYKLIDELAEKGYLKKREGFPISVPYIEYSDGFIMAYDIVGPL